MTVNVSPSSPSRFSKTAWNLIGYAALAALAYAARGRLTEPAANRRRSHRHTAFNPDRPDFESNRRDETGATSRSEIEASSPTDRSQANQPGRGRRAKSPWQIPWAGWKDILWRTWHQINEDRLLAIAAGVVFYGLLALFPAITAFVSLYGLFADTNTINQHISIAAGLMPEGALNIFTEQVTRITEKGGAKLGFGFVFGLGLALWSANAGMKALIDALNVIYGEKEKRSFIKLNLISLAFTIGGIVAALLAIGSIVVLPIVLNFIGLGGWSETLISLARWEWLAPGTVLASLLWLAGSALLSWYIQNFAGYDETYGSLGAAIGLMVWMWFSSIVILFGAEINSEIEHQTARDTTVGRPRPLGARGARMADQVGAAAE
jgi:membrane protein